MSSNHKPIPPKPRRTDFVLFGPGPSGVGCLDATGLHYHGDFFRRCPRQLDMIDVGLDWLDPANEGPDEQIPGREIRRAHRLKLLAERPDGSLPV